MSEENNVSSHHAEPSYTCPKCQHSFSEPTNECPKCRNILFLDSSTIEERLSRFKKYSWGEILLKEREYLLEAIYNNESLPGKLLYFGMYFLVFSLVYGAILGAPQGTLPALFMAAKVFVLFLIVSLIVTPILFTFNIFIGSKLSFLQTLVVVSLANYMIGFCLISFSPILVLFVFFAPHATFINLLNGVILIISCGLGLSFIWQGIRYFVVKNCYQPQFSLLKIWTVIYAFVGLQIFWTLDIMWKMEESQVMARVSKELNFYEAVFQLIKAFVAE